MDEMIHVNGLDTQKPNELRTFIKFLGQLAEIWR